MMYTNEWTIFALDNGSDPYVQYRFMKRVNELKALTQIKPVRLCIGSWMNELEYSYCLRKQDFDRYFMEGTFVKKQECVMQLHGVNPRNLSRLHVYLDWRCGEKEKLGQLVEVNKEDADCLESWTYFCDTGKYFVTER
jgi:hypothetical protein